MPKKKLLSGKNFTLCIPMSIDTPTSEIRVTRYDLEGNEEILFYMRAPKEEWMD